MLVQTSSADTFPKALADALYPAGLGAPTQVAGTETQDSMWYKGGSQLERSIQTGESWPEQVNALLGDLLYLSSIRLYFYH